MGVPRTPKEQGSIMRTAGKNYLFEVGVDFEELACQFLAERELSPADLADITHSAMRIALRKVIQRSNVGDDYTITINIDDMIEAIRYKVAL